MSCIILTTLFSLNPHNTKSTLLNLLGFIDWIVGSSRFESLHQKIWALYKTRGVGVNFHNKLKDLRYFYATHIYDFLPPSFHRLWFVFLSSSLSFLFSSNYWMTNGLFKAPLLLIMFPSFFHDWNTCSTLESSGFCYCVI